MKAKKAADALRGIGIAATTSLQGAQSPQLTEWVLLGEKDFIIWPDNDENGRKYAEKVAKLLSGSAKSVSVIDTPEGAGEKDDAADYLARLSGKDLDERRNAVLALAEQAKPAEFEQEPSPDAPPTFAGVDASELAELANEPTEWLVTNVIAREQPTIFGARAKCGKTTLLSDLAVALATGTDWLGHFPVERQSKVLFITGEATKKAAARRIDKAVSSRGRLFNGEPQGATAY